MRCQIKAAALLLTLWPAVAPAQTNLPTDKGRLDRDQPATQPPDDRLKPPPDVALPAAAAQIDAAGQAVPIRSIRFKGSQVPQIVARAAEGFIGRAPDQPTLQQLVQAMTAAYGRSPVALFTILIPAQDLSTGTLIVAVGEGHVESVVLTGEVEGRSLKLVKAYAGRLTQEKPTSRRTLERYLSLIRDIPGLKVDANLQMGQTPGGVRVVLKLDYNRPTVTFSFDNRTTRLVKDGQVQGVGRLFGLLREGDLTEFTAASSVDVHDFLYAGLSHSTPIGDNGMRAALSLGYLRTRPDSSIIEGQAKTANFTLSYPVIRGYRRNLTASASIDGINSDNAALGSLIATERTRAARIALGYGQSLDRTSFSASLIGSKGLAMLGARTDPLLAQTGFAKFNARLALDQAIGKRAAIRLRTSGQFSNDRLPAAERFNVGGADFGRAFETALISADRGIAGLAEFVFRPLKSGHLRQSEIYAFADNAWVGINPRSVLPRFNLDMGSAGAGVRLAFRDKARLELEAARPFDDPYPGYDRRWRFSIGWKLSLRS